MTEAVDNKYPQIRFRGFEEPWNESTLGNKVEFYSGLTYAPVNVQKGSGTLVLRSSNVKNGEIVDADNVYVDPKIVNSKNVAIGDIAVVVRNGSRSLIGKHARIQKEMKNTVIGAFMTGVQSERPSFTNALLDTTRFNQEVAKNLGATINQITTGAFKEMVFHFPLPEEQTKIGSFFKELDQLIGLHQQKHDKLVALKQSMLQKMFPQGETRCPEIRFKGFDGAWQETSLGDLCEIIGGGTPSTSVPDFWNGCIDWYSPAEIGKSVYASGSVRKITQLGLDKCSARILPAKRTVLFTSRAGIGDIAILTKDGCTNQGFQSLVLNEGVEPYFMFSMGFMIKRFALKRASGSTFLEISSKQLARMKLFVPEESEQKKISSYFRNIDKLISSHRMQITKLKQIKAACLDKMFV